MLEVIALSLDDVVAAKGGGADRVELVGTMKDDGLSPSPDLVMSIQDACDLPLRVMLRTEPGFASTEPGRLRELAAAYSELGVDGIVLGYLRDGEVDRVLMGELLDQVSTEYTFHRAIDHAQDPVRAWADVTSLGGNLTSVLVAGSPQGVGAGMDHLRELAANYAPLMLVGGGLRPSHVPQLTECGITRFHVGSGVRPDGDFNQPVDPYLVEAWVSLIDRS